MALSNLEPPNVAKNGELPRGGAAVRADRECSMHQAGVEGFETATVYDAEAAGRERGKPIYPLQARVVNRAGIAEIQGSLEALSELYREHACIESVLRTASRVVVDILKLEHCSVGWLDEGTLNIRLCTSHNREGAKVNRGQVMCAMSSFVKRGPPAHYNRTGAVCGSRLNGCAGTALELTAPLRIDKRIVGYLYGVRGEPESSPLMETDCSLFLILTQHISAAIQAQRRREMVGSPLIALSLTPREKGGVATLPPAERRALRSVSNWKEAARKIAHRFFADLLDAGFETKQILFVVTEIVGSVNSALRKAKPRGQNLA